LKAKAKGTKVEKAKQVGTDLAARAIEKKVLKIVFDRSCYKYHGRVKAIADGAREGGLQF
jgi:large subunit ribosomal protein L18